MLSKGNIRSRGVGLTYGILNDLLAKEDSILLGLTCHLRRENYPVGGRLVLFIQFLKVIRLQAHNFNNMFM